MEDNPGILFQEFGQNRNLLVSFGGIRQGFGIPTFEFSRSLENLNCNKVFIRDFNQSWYHKGVDEKFSNLNSLKDYLDDLKAQKDYDKICFIGNSMGGYAAILFGVLINVDHVISFSPQTFIDRYNRFINFDFRWRKQINKVYKDSITKEYFDLKNLLLKTKYKTDIEIHYSSTHRLDRIHSERLEGIDNVKLSSYGSGGHNIVKEIRDSGRLDLLLSNTFN